MNEIQNCKQLHSLTLLSVKPGDTNHQDTGWIHAGYVYALNEEICQSLAAYRPVNNVYGRVRPKIRTNLKNQLFK